MSPPRNLQFLLPFQVPSLAPSFYPESTMQVSYPPSPPSPTTRLESSRPCPLPLLPLPPQASRHLIERCHSLGQLRLDLGQGLRLLQGLLQLLLGVVQPLRQLTTLLFTLGEDRDTGKGGARSHEPRPRPHRPSLAAPPHLPVQRLLAGQLVLQFVVGVVQRRGLALGTQIALLQRRDPFLHILPLRQRLQRWQRAACALASGRPGGSLGLEPPPGTPGNPGK